MTAIATTKETSPSPVAPRGVRTAWPAVVSHWCRRIRSAGGWAGPAAPGSAASCIHPTPPLLAGNPVPRRGQQRDHIGDDIHEHVERGEQHDEENEESGGIAVVGLGRAPRPAARGRGG